MRIDYDRINRLFKERPRGCRGVGRTFAATWKALQLLKGQEERRLAFPGSHMHQLTCIGIYAKRIAEAEGFEIECATNAKIRVVGGGELTLFILDPRYLDQRLSSYSGVADDLGEYADIHTCPQTEPARRLMAGEAPLEPQP